MRRSRVQVNKAQKTRFSSKTSRILHRTSLKDSGRIWKSDSTHVKGARAAPVQHYKMLQAQKREAVLKEKRTSRGLTSFPPIIVGFTLLLFLLLVPMFVCPKIYKLVCCLHGNRFCFLSLLPWNYSLGEDILKLLSLDGYGVGSYSTVTSYEYRLRAIVLKAPSWGSLTCMAMAKVADLMAFVASASFGSELNISNYIDSFRSQCLSALRTVVYSSTTVLICDFPSGLKKKNELKELCVSYLASQFLGDCKFYPTYTINELHKFKLS